DVDSVARPNGAEDAWYRAQPSAALAANAPIVRVAELAALRNFTAQSADALAPYVAALPPETKLNVNTAPPEVLAAAISGLDSGGGGGAGALARGGPVAGEGAPAGRSV